MYDKLDVCFESPISDSVSGRWLKPLCADYKDELQLLGILPQSELVENLRRDAKNKKRRAGEKSLSPTAKSLKGNCRQSRSMSLTSPQPNHLQNMEFQVMTDMSHLPRLPGQSHIFSGANFEDTKPGLPSARVQSSMHTHPFACLEPAISFPDVKDVLPPSPLRSDTPLPLVDDAEIGFGVGQGSICATSDIATDFGERRELLLGEPGAVV